MTLIARKEYSSSYSIDALFVAAAIYLAINFLATRGIMWLEFRLTPELREARISRALPDQDVASVPQPR
jgi:octopine/nopaline transport system permease protein